MSNENTPPWDINRPIQNPIDQANIFTQPQDIFSLATSITQANSNKDSNENINESKLTKNTQNQDTNSTNQIFLSNATNTENKEISSPKLKQDEKAISNMQPQQNIYPQSMQTQNIQNKNDTITQIKETQTPHNDSTEAIALALKYRPKTFAELVGQESVARTLCLALDSKKIANAYLFSGLRGSGKTSSARILARSLQCEHGITSSPCGNCPNCMAALKGSHLDIIELDGASNRKIDDIRDLIEQTHYKPTLGRFKVFIIDEVHMLTKEAFNSLLKTLEEPPSYVKFILATTDPLKVPPTILSRTQHFRFKKIPINALKNHLAHILQKENVLTDNESLDMIIRNGHGSVRDTLTLLDQAIVFCQGELTTQKLADMLGALDPKAFDVLFQALLSKNMQACIQFAHSLEGYEIEMILDELSLYIKNKMLEEIPQIPPVLGMRYANIINDSKAMLQLDCDSEFCLLLTILKMFEAQKIREVAHAIKQLESMQINTEITQLAKDYLTSSAQNNQDNATSLTQTQNSQTQSNIENTHSTQFKITESSLTTDNIQKEGKEEIQLTQDSITNTNANIEKQDEKDTIIEQNQEAKQDSINLDSKESIEANIKDENEAQNTESIQQEAQKMQDTQEVMQNNNDPLFKSLITKLYDRDYTIGNLFENKIIYEKLENTTIYLTFYLTQDELELLRQGYSGIMQIMREVYGDSIKMQVEKQNPQDIIMRKNINNIAMQANINTNKNHTESNINTHSKNEIKQDSIFTDSKDTDLKTDEYSNKTQNTDSMQTEAEKDPAMNFITQNSDIVKSMKNELGIKEVKILSLDIL